MNYIQYLTEAKKLKTLEITIGQDNFYKINTINELFFITSVFINNVRVNGVSFQNTNNADMLAVINDLSLVDSDFIELSAYFNSNQEIIISVSQNNGNNHVVVDNLPLTQNVHVDNQPTQIAVNNFPATQNVNVQNQPTQIAVNNFPATQNVHLDNTSQVSVKNFPAIQNVHLDNLTVKYWINNNVIPLSFFELSEDVRYLILMSQSHNISFDFNYHYILPLYTTFNNSNLVSGDFGGLFYGLCSETLYFSHDNLTWFLIPRGFKTFARYWKGAGTNVNAMLQGFVIGGS